MPKAEPAVHLIRRKAIDPPDEPLATPARFTTGQVVRTVSLLKRDHLATTLAKRSRVVAPAYLPSGPSILDRAAGIVREETVLRVNGRKRVQSRIQRLEGMGDAPLPRPLVAKYLPDRDHADLPRPSIPEPPRVHCADEWCDCRDKAPASNGRYDETLARITHAETLLWLGWMPSAVRAEVRGS